MTRPELGSQQHHEDPSGCDPEDIHAIQIQSWVLSGLALEESPQKTEHRLAGKGEATINLSNCKEGDSIILFEGTVKNYKVVLDILETPTDRNEDTGLVTPMVIRTADKAVVCNVLMVELNLWFFVSNLVKT